MSWQTGLPIRRRPLEIGLRGERDILFPAFLDERVKVALHWVAEYPSRASQAGECDKILLVPQRLAEGIDQTNPGVSWLVDG